MKTIHTIVQYAFPQAHDTKTVQVLRESVKISRLLSMIVLMQLNLTCS
jgi:hypothetical protein